MTWKDFISPICESKITSNTAQKTLLNLFKRAEAENEISDATAKSWLYGKRNCKTSRYFSEGAVNVEGLFSYFRSRPNNKIRQLQQIFRKNEDIDPNSPIDIKTEDLDIFCWSLVNQFLDLLGLQRVNMPCTDASTEEASAPIADCQEAALSKDVAVDSEQVAGQLADAVTPCDLLLEEGTSAKATDSQETDSSKDSTIDQEQVAGQQTDNTVPFEQVANTDTSCDVVTISGTDTSLESQSIRSMILPHSGRECCYNCDYWNGTRDLGSLTIPKYGPCWKHSGSERLSTDMPCKDYKKRLKGLLSSW